jgi:hypothetical protein
MVKDNTHIMREETRCRHMDYSYRKAARDLVYKGQYIYHDLCYSSPWGLVGAGENPNGSSEEVPAYT